MPSTDAQALDWVVQNRAKDPAKASEVMSKLGVDAKDVDAWQFTKDNPSSPAVTPIKNKIFDKLAESKRPLDETKGFPAIERIAIKNFADEGQPEVVSEFMKKRGFITRIQGGKVQARLPSENAFRNVEPSSIDKWDLADFAKEAILDVTDIGRELVEAGVGIVTTGSKIAGAGLGGPVGLAATSAASGAVTAGVEAGRQLIGQAIGVREGFKPGLVGEAATLGAAIPLGIGAAGGAIRATGTAIGKTSGLLPSFRLKPGARGIQEATERLGAKVTPAQVVDSPLVQKTEELLVKGGDLKLGRLITDLPGKVRASKKVVQNAADDILKGRSFREDFDVGSEVGKKLSAGLERRIKPAVDTYQKYEKAFKDVRPDTTRLARVLDELTDEFKFDDEAAKVLKSQAAKLDDIVSLDDLKKFRTSTGKLLRDQKATRAAKQIYDTATEIRSETLINAANKSRLVGAKAEIEEADRIYREAALAVQNAVLGRKVGVKTGVKETLKDFLARTKEVDRIKKILDTNDPVRIAAIRKDFPDVFEALRQQKIEQIAKNAEIKGEVSPTRLAKALRGLPEKSKILLFGEAGGKTEQALETYLNSLPQPFNTSNTQNMAEFASALSPLNQISNLAKSFMLDVMVNTQLGTSLIQRAGKAVATPGLRGGAIGFRGLVPEEPQQKGLTAPKKGR